MPSYLNINDDYLPAVPKPSLQQYDNYQIYDIVCVDRSYATNTKEYYQTGYRGLLTVVNPVTHVASLVPYNPIEITNSNSEIRSGSWLAIQAFSPSKIRINFLDYVNTYHE
jgi:hypothetical protein